MSCTFVKVQNDTREKENATTFAKRPQDKRLLPWKKVPKVEQSPAVPGNGCARRYNQVQCKPTAALVTWMCPEALRDLSPSAFGLQAGSCRIREKGDNSNI